MIDTLADLFSDTQAWLFQALVQPIVFALGFGGFTEQAFDGTGWLLVGLVQLVVMLVVLWPAERRWPVEPVTDRRAIATDIAYTLIHRLGAFRLALFFSLEPLLDDVIGSLRTAGLGTWHLDQIWPGVTDIAWVSLLIYLVVFDFVDYWIHRGQHRFQWWWALHALHHSQRQMTMWSDNRNHLLDDVIRDVILVAVALGIGVGPGQFIAIVAITQLSENLQHANLRLHFGRWGERLWVSPRFHRLHHAIGIGHESIDAQGKPHLGGCNYAVLLPVWDTLFGTANYQLNRFDPTGIRDQVEPDAQGRVRHYGSGLLAQQWLGLKRMLGWG